MHRNYNFALAKALIFLRPNHPAGHTILAKAFSKDKSLDKALECWTEARGRFPNQDRIIRGRMRTLKSLHRYDEAVKEAEQLIALNPDDSSGYVYRAKVLMSQERFDLALKYWTEARSRFPKDLEVIQGQVKALLELGRFDEGLSEAKHLIDLYPRRSEGYVCVAELLVGQGRFAAAMEQLNQIGSRFRDNRRTNRCRIQALRELGEYKQALDEADRLIAKNPAESLWYVERFDILYRASLYRDAYSFILEHLRNHGPSRSILIRFVWAAIAVKGQKFARRFCYHMICAYPQRSSNLFIRYLYLSAESGGISGINAAISKFSSFAPFANDKMNLILAMSHASNLDMYKSLEHFIAHSSTRRHLYTVSQIIVMAAVLGDRKHARQGLIALYRYQEFYRLRNNQPLYSNVRMHLRYNIIDDEIETLMAELALLMKDEQYDRVFRIASDYVSDHKMETSLSCVYLIAALKSGAYEFETSDKAPEPRMMFYWDKPEIPRPIGELIEMNKSNNPDLECRVYSDESAKEFLKEHFDSYVLEAYGNAAHPSQKGDIFRLAYLYKMGGYYIDADDLVFARLGKYFAGVGSAYFIESIGHVGNNFLATTSGNRIFQDMLIEASENVATGAFDGCIWRGTGPGLVSRHLARQVNDIVLNGRDRDVRISLPCEHKGISSYHLTMNYKKDGFHWMGGEEDG